MARAEQSEPVSITQKKQRRGSITFSREVRVKVIPSLSDDAAERIWYTEDEYAALGKECVLVAKEMRRLYRREGKQNPNQTSGPSSAQQHPNSEITVRGLEHLSSKEACARRHNQQRRNIDTVLMAQENNYAPDDIAAIYARQSIKSKTWAISLGEMDAEEAGAIHRNARRRSSYMYYM